MVSQSKRLYDDDPRLYPPPHTTITYKKLFQYLPKKNKNQLCNNQQPTKQNIIDPFWSVLYRQTQIIIIILSHTQRKCYWNFCFLLQSPPFMAFMWYSSTENTFPIMIIISTKKINNNSLCHKWIKYQKAKSFKPFSKQI